MAYVVTQACVKCKYTDCVAVCPVDCFYEGENMLVIHPDECIDCGACEPECPSTAIFEESDLRPDQQVFVGINAVFSGASHISEVDTREWPAGLRASAAIWPNITEQKEPLPDADDFKDATGKLKDLSPRPGGE